MRTTYFRWNTRAKVRFELSAFCVGIFWSQRPCLYSTGRGYCVRETEVRICLIPCIPIYVVYGSKYTKQLYSFSGGFRR